MRVSYTYRTDEHKTKEEERRAYIDFPMSGFHWVGVRTCSPNLVKYLCLSLFVARGPLPGRPRDYVGTGKVQTMYVTSFSYPARWKHLRMTGSMYPSTRDLER
jgi:hypothetical protein